MTKEQLIETAVKYVYREISEDVFLTAVEAYSSASNDGKPLVSGSPSFKEQLINDFIPRIEEMKEKELKHLHWLIDNDAPNDFITLSQKYYNHFTQRIKEYKKYAERL